MMLGYYDAAALADLLGDADRLMATVDEAVGLLARAADAAAADDDVGESAPSPPPRAGAPAAKSDGAAGAGPPEDEVERVVRQRVLEHADGWPEHCAEEDREQLRSAVRKELGGENGHWVSAALLQVRAPLFSSALHAVLTLVALQIARRPAAASGGRAALIGAVYGQQLPEVPATADAVHVRKQRPTPRRKQLSSAAGADFGSVQLAPR